MMTSANEHISQALAWRNQRQALREKAQQKNCFDTEMRKRAEERMGMSRDVCLLTPKQIVNDVLLCYEIDSRLSGLNFSNRGAMTSPLMDQIVESGVQQNTDDVRTQKASGSRKANSRQKQAKDKGEGYSDRMGERMASKAHRRDRVAKLKRMY